VKAGKFYLPSYHRLTCPTEPSRRKVERTKTIFHRPSARQARSKQFVDQLELPLAALCECPGVRIEAWNSMAIEPYVVVKLAGIPMRAANGVTPLSIVARRADASIVEHELER
jgi:hypothetical protein